MGLDTSHDCWHGPYSMFHRWRMWLNLYICQDRGMRCSGATEEELERAWRDGLYADQSDPLNVLMNHSDCDGEIDAAVCGPLADALERLVEKYMKPRGTYDHARPATERFIAGLRRAAAAGEPVLFG